MDLLHRIRGIVGPVSKNMGLDLIDITLSRRGKAVIVDIVVDFPKGGVGLSDCTKLNRIVSNDLESQDFIPEEYIVEVSSPGIDRPLVTQKDFERTMGRNIRFHLKEKIEGKLEHQGVVIKADEDGVELQSKNINILYTQISKAVQII